MATTSEIASAWGCSRQAVSKWVLRGMPTTSVEAASKWRMSHGQRAPRVKILPDLPPPPELPEADPDLSPMLADGDSQSAALARARKSELTAYALLQKYVDAKDFQGILAAQRNFNFAQAGRASAEEAFIKQQSKESALVDREQALATQVRKLAAIREHLLSLPEAVAKLCNPNDPTTAMQALSEWVNRTLYAAVEA